MSIVDMRCPRCGRQATEYEENKWRCLNCNTKFIYEGPVQPNNYNLEEHVHIIDEDTHFFTCAVCGGTFPKTNTPMYRCRKCGATLCAAHAVFEEPDQPPVCIKCPPVPESQASWIDKIIKDDIKLSMGGIAFMALAIVGSVKEWKVLRPPGWLLVLLFVGGLLLTIWAVWLLIKDYRMKRDLEDE